MLFNALRAAKDWAQKESQKDGGILSRLWAFLDLVPKGQTFSLVVVIILASYFSKIYENQITLFSVLAVLFFLWKGRQWLRWPLLLFCGYLILSAFWHFGVDDGLNSKIQIVSVAVIGRQTIYAMLLVGATIVLDVSVSWLAPIFLLLCSLITLTGLSPILKNPSTNAAMIVLCLPYCRKWWMWLLTLCVMITQQGATAWLMFAAILLVTAARHLNKTLISVSMSGSAGLVGTLWFTKPHFFIFSDRWDEYKLAYRFFREFANPVFGFGLGTFQVLGPAMQKWDSRPVTEVWMSLHSDWLQLIFELGLLGASLGIWLLLDAYLQADRKTRLLLIASSLFGLFYFPMQIPLVAFFITLIVVQTQKRI